MNTSSHYTIKDLPGLDCGLCGLRSCEELANRLQNDPNLIKRCIYLSKNNFDNQQTPPAKMDLSFPDSLADQKNRTPDPRSSLRESYCTECQVSTSPSVSSIYTLSTPWRDSLGREFDFYLEHFPEDPGPREIILPHNPMITREMEVKVGDILIGRPLGMSCGCPITHCGVAIDVDTRTGVIVWCVTGPLNPRQKGYKDLGYYIAEGYEGIVTESRCELKIGMRYFFQPRMCMLQWRHSGLINYLNRMGTSYQVRLEGLWIG